MSLFKLDLTGKKMTKVALRMKLFHPGLFLFCFLHYFWMSKPKRRRKHTPWNKRLVLLTVLNPFFPQTVWPHYGVLTVIEKHLV